MSRRVRLVHRENLLADLTQFSSDRRRADEKVLQSQAGDSDYPAATPDDAGNSTQKWVDVAANDHVAIRPFLRYVLWVYIRGNKW